jgi:GrpB-like predicted nucleotidyltransferase (UPF0157 family)
MKDIIVVEHNPKWEDEYNKAKSFYEKIMSDIDVEIVHVGSTSVKDLWAKPVLDIDIIVDCEEDSKRAIKALVNIGYIHVGNRGIPGREAFTYDEENFNLNWMEHHLYVCLKGNENVINHLLLKKHLIKSKKDRDAYSNLKRKLAKKYPNDIDSYVYYKTALILSFLKEEGMNMEELKRIEEENNND